MLNQYVDLLREEFDKQQAFNHVKEICQHHRIQASPGHRAAADYCAEAFKSAGLATEVLTYPGDGQTSYWNYLMPEEWSATKGVLELLEPSYEVLSDYNKVPISLIQRSVATAKNGVEAELIILDNGDEEENYPDIDFKGKIVFTSGDYDYIREWAVGNRGAIGIVTDRMAEIPPVRYRSDLSDALTYTSFWWYGYEHRCFGFVVSPNEGDRLRDRAAKGELIIVRATVDAKFYSGDIEVVSALIKGKSKQEVVVTAHLCHPQPSANDNASGCGVAIETARALQALIKKGKLTKPERSIRFLLLPEMSGSYAFLANHENLISNMVAALNLDMVGEDQNKCQGPLVAVRPPHACGHYAGDLIEASLEAVAKEVPNLNGTSKYALFKHTMSPFTGGSDHYIFADPTVGVGAPMLIQWPDKYYHTSMDTIDKVDPEMLKRVGALTGTYAWFNAVASNNEILWLSDRMITMFNKSIGIYINNQLSLALDSIKQQDYRQASKISSYVAKHLRYLLNVKSAELDSLKKLTTDSQTEKWVDDKVLDLREIVIKAVSDWDSLYQQLLITNDLLATQADTPPTIDTDKWLRQARNIKPMRLSKGPLSLRGRICHLTIEDQKTHRQMSLKYKGEFSKMTYILYWMDGNRNLADIIDLIEHEIGSINHEVAVYLVSLLAKLGLVKLQ